MSLPPERISIKRRRQDEPVDTLILEPGLTQGTKRRFTDFYFQRLRQEGTASVSSRVQNAIASPIPPVNSSRSVRDYQSFGIPSVKTTAPGDELNDFARYRAAQKNKSNESDEISPNITEPDYGSSLQSSSAAVSLPQQTASARRFHLTRDLSSTLRSNTSGGSGRHKISLRPPLATFIERHSVQDDGVQSIHRMPPVDSIVELKDNTATSNAGIPLVEDAIVKRTHVNTFLKSSHSTSKRGISIRDDPSTWNHDSDQLANELAALAFDIDPADATEPPRFTPTVASNVASEPTALPTEPMVVDGGDDEFVFETYVRVKHDIELKTLSHHRSAEVGILVIDDENEDLWERYIQSDDDNDDWDEEDEDSNAEDNPRNEYPDDEVSSDDEFGRNVYKYRHNASDTEEYGEEMVGW